MKKTLLLFIIALGLSGCHFFTDWRWWRSYVYQYNDAGSISLSDAETVFHVEGIRISFENLSLIGSYGSVDEEKIAAYDALCEKHGDMTYNRNVNIHSGMPYDPNIGLDFLSIDIVSDSDYDESHVAGTSLADITLFHGGTLKPFIDSGYAPTGTYTNYSSVESLLTDLTPDQLTLLNPGTMYLKFVSLPTLSKTHNFTVTMTADDGRVFSDTIEMTFE